jgi:hypothetical protein
VSVLLGFATKLDPSAPREAGEAVGLGPALVESVGESSKLSAGTWWSVAIVAVFALLWSANSAARAIRAVHSLAWEGRVGQLQRPLPAALALLAAMAAFAVVIGVAGRARAEFGMGGLLISVAAFAAFAAIWLGLALLLPHGDADWKALIPGALLVALGIQVIHLGTVLFMAEKIERASETYGSLGVAFTLLFWLFVVSRVIVASAMLNAALALEQQSTPEEAPHHDPRRPPAQLTELPLPSDRNISAACTRLLTSAASARPSFQKIALMCFSTARLVRNSASAIAVLLLP